LALSIPKFAGHATTSAFRVLWDGGNAIALPGDFRVCNSLIQLSWCPRFFDFRRRHAVDLPRLRFSACIVTEERATLLPRKTAAAICTLSWCRMLFRLVQVIEESGVPADGGAIHLRSSSNGVTDCQIEEFPAGVALLSDIEALRANASNFSSGKPHETPPALCLFRVGIKWFPVWLRRAWALCYEWSEPKLRQTSAAPEFVL
jgi:hypothetical protein